MDWFIGSVSVWVGEVGGWLGFEPGIAPPESSCGMILSAWWQSSTNMAGLPTHIDAADLSVRG